MIKIIAVLCNLSSPANCHEQTVTTSDFADVSMQSCLMGAPQLADWMKLHPVERLAGWRCVIGTQDGRELRVESHFPGCVEPLKRKGCDY
nr:MULTISPECIES: hypothetical protein [unclassified Bradyrhizobium]